MMNVKDIEKHVLELEETAKWMNDKAAKKIIIVPKRIINIVV
jgi:leucyl-tRNA synthetase